jgi:predicted  nucleic acid-binding Zn-ribbon protein
VSGKYLTLNDFSIDVKNVKDYYTPNEEVSLKITVTPKNDDIAKEMSNRKYTFYNYLNTPRKTTVQISFKNGPIYSQSTTDKILVINREYTNWDQGIDSISLNVSGYVPSISSGVEKFTVFEIEIENADTIKVNVTVVNPPKLESEISNLKNELSQVEKEINDLSKKTDVSDLKSKLSDVKRDLNDIEVLYNNKHYEDVSEKIDDVKNKIETLKLDTKKSYAKYYVNSAEDLINKIDVNLTKAESLIDLLKSSGKNVLDYTLKLADLKAEKSSLEDDVKDLRDLYDNGKYDDVISEGTDILKRENSLLEKISTLTEDLRKLIEVTPTTQTTIHTTTTNATSVKLPKVNWRIVGFYGGIVAGAIVVVALAVIGLKRYMRRRRWDELK